MKELALCEVKSRKITVLNKCMTEDVESSAPAFHRPTC